VKLRQKEEMEINTYSRYQGLSAVFLKAAAVPRPLSIPAKLLVHHLSFKNGGVFTAKRGSP
jgi:hypothetical protein